VKDIDDVIKHAKFGDDRLRGSGVVAGQISAFPIDFAGRPYNTFTLPCERVMLITGWTTKSCGQSMCYIAAAQYLPKCPYDVKTGTFRLTESLCQL